MLEESFEWLNKEQCAAYLKRLGLSQPEELSSGFLNQLIRAHLYKIPFENLELIRNHEVIPTDLDTVYQKVVLDNRGGYCFELNALFLGLLRGLGYTAYPVACRVLMRPGLRMPTHRASVVCVEGRKYFCDVGYGGIACTCGADMEPGAVTETEFGRFFFERECFGWLNFWYQSKKNGQEKPIKIFMVSEIPSAPVDFDMANEKMCRQGSMFYDKIIVQKITPYGPISINGSSFTMRGKMGKNVSEISSREELIKILKEEFQIEAPL